ncbi:hypothetical protein [Ruminococcus sp. YRD2003]
MTGYALCESSRLSKEKKQIINDSEVIEEMHDKPAPQITSLCASRTLR